MNNILTEVDPKDPDEAKFYTMYAAPRLNTSATISSATWSCPGLSFSSGITTNETATIKISGGTHGQTYRVRCTIVTSDGETLIFVGDLAVRRAESPQLGA